MPGVDAIALRPRHEDARLPARESLEAGWLGRVPYRAAWALQRRLARARAEDRIRGLKDNGLRNLPLHDFAQNQIWLETVLLAATSRVEARGSPHPIRLRRRSTESRSRT